MKTFKDLEFKRHRVFPFYNQHAEIVFDNGYGVSVINGDSAYCDENTYELAVIKDGYLCYETPITSAVVGYLSPDEITRIMEELQSYAKNQY